MIHEYIMMTSFNGRELRMFILKEALSDKVYR